MKTRPNPIRSLVDVACGSFGAIMLLAVVRLSTNVAAPQTNVSARVEVEIYGTKMELTSPRRPGVLLNKQQLLMFAPNAQMGSVLQCKLKSVSGYFPRAARITLSGNAFSTSLLNQLRSNPWVEIRGAGTKLNVRVTIDPGAVDPQKVVHLTAGNESS